jgi:hypothetical protein
MELLSHTHKNILYIHKYTHTHTHTHTRTHTHTHTHTSDTDWGQIQDDKRSTIDAQVAKTTDHTEQTTLLVKRLQEDVTVLRSALELLSKESAYMHAPCG